MNEKITAFLGAQIFDGTDMRKDHALVVRGDRVQSIVQPSEIPKGAAHVELDEGTLSPGFVDLQVNGGGGIMFNDEPSAAALGTIAAAHAGLGATSILPTLITDTPTQTRAAVAAVEEAVAQGMPGIAGLHLEGPHLSLARKGAHDPSLIRPMEPADLSFLLDAAERLPVLKVTVAPEAVTPEQMKRLSAVGIVLSLGHTDASYAECVAAARNGARCVTHLFNAMSQFGNREPGLVGAALDCGDLSAGLIADLIHVHPVAIKTALLAKRSPGRIYLVSDAMATSGSRIDHFDLNGRRISRRDGRLTLSDGTLAGADLDLATAIQNIVEVSQVSLARALGMATSVPASLIAPRKRMGHLASGARADFVHLSATGDLDAVWQSGHPVTD